MPRLQHQINLTTWIGQLTSREQEEKASVFHHIHQHLQRVDKTQLAYQELEQYKSVKMPNATLTRPSSSSFCSNALKLFGDLSFSTTSNRLQTMPLLDTVKPNQYKHSTLNTSLTSLQCCATTTTTCFIHTKTTF